MSVLYRVAKIKNVKTQKVTFYPKAVVMGVVTTEKLAEKIQRNCTVKKSDVLAVLSEMAEVITDEIQASKRVVLDGLGSFKIGIISKGSDKPSDVTVANNVKGVKVIFMPQVKTDSTGVQNKAFITGCNVEALPEATQYTDDDAEDTASTDSGSSDTGGSTDAGTDSGSTDTGSDTGGSTDTGTDTGSGDGDSDGGSDGGDDAGGSGEGSGEEEQP